MPPWVTVAADKADALSRFIQNVTSRAVMGVPSDHFQCFMVMVTVWLLFDQVGALAMLSAGLYLGWPLFPNQYR